MIDNMPILHCTEIQKVFDNRRTDNINGVKEEYHDFIKKTDEEIDKIYHQVYGKLAQLLKIQVTFLAFSNVSILIKLIIKLFSLA